MRSRVLAAALMLCASVGVASCGSPDPQPLPIAQQFAAAVESANYAAAASLTTVSAASLGAPYQQLLTSTKAVKVAISLGAMTVDATKKHASAPFQTTVTPEGYASWTWPGTLPLVRAGKTWQVVWTRRLSIPSWWRASRSRSPRRSVLGYGPRCSARVVRCWSASRTSTRSA